MAKPLTEKQEAWLKELESGKHKQSRSLLKTKDDKFCCLGIACEFILKSPSELDGLRYKYEGGPFLLGTSEILQMGFRGEVGHIDPLKIEDFRALMMQCGFNDPNPPGFIFEALAQYNDQAATFAQIAAAIRKMPEAVFVQD